ncbi:MAG: aldo/keto reductase [Cyclobacteriaceae bacterium]
MRLKELGRTGLKVSPIGIGLAALGRPGYINLGHAHDLNKDYNVKSMEKNAHQVLDLALEFGIRYFDVARSYGKAEAFLSSWLHKNGLKPESVVTGSKWGYTYTADWKVEATAHEIKDHSHSVLKQQLEESRAQLGEFLKLYQIHSATRESGVLKNQEVLEELHLIKQSGTSIGLSVSGPLQNETILEALEVTFDGVRLFDTVQATWNLLEQSATSALQAAHQEGLGVIIKEALANGRLTDKNSDPDFEDKIYLFEYHEKQLDTTIDALAIAAALYQPWVDVVLSGASTLDQLKSNLKAITVGWSEQIASELSFMREETQQYWRLRSELPWN